MYVTQGGIRILERLRWGMTQKRLGNTDLDPNKRYLFLKNTWEPYKNYINTSYQNRKQTIGNFKQIDFQNINGLHTAS